MGRLDALRHIAGDAQLKDEILTRISEDRDLVDGLLARAGRPAADGAHAVPGRPPARESASPETAAAAETAGATGTPATPDPRAAPVTPDRARAVLEAPPDTPADPALEAIVLLLGRPVLLVHDDDVDLTALETDSWRERLGRAGDVVRAAIPAVGRVELLAHPQLDWAGTGWLVDHDIVVTNRHVAELFARRQHDGAVFRPGPAGMMGARVDFREEAGGGRPAEFPVVEVLHIEEDAGPDLAFLRVDWPGGAAPGGRAPLPLAAAVTPGAEVAVIGYPAKDSRTRIPDEMDRIFGNVYDVKRLAPGLLSDDPARTDLVTHDCTTLGGNSGSVVLDLASGAATALHFAGRERDRNFAVPAPLVRERLERIRASGGGRRHAPVPAVPALADLDGRDGYRPDFLGEIVAHPGLSPELEGALAPVHGRDDGVLDYRHYSVRMHRTRRLAMYVAVNIDGARARNVRRGRDRWSLDPRLAPELQAGEELYARNKLDRGHLVRRLDPAWGDTFEDAAAAAEDTFFFTNCAPQHATHNQRLWLGLEDHILGNAGAHELKVSVFSGPIFRDDDRVYRGVQIPEDYWKVVALVDDATGKLSATGYVVSQRDFMGDLEFAFGPFETYQVAIATITQQTGLDFGVLADLDPFGAVETAPARPLHSLDDIVI